MFFLKRFDSTANIYLENNILKFKFIHQYFTLLLILKNQGHNIIFRLVDNVTDTRSNNVNLVCPVFRTELFKNCVISYAPSLFNIMPNDKKVILQSTNILKYKKEMRNNLLNQQNLTLIL